ncbi:MAG: hypothetical protein PQ964_08220 [Methanobacteriaceae archaeon]|jgi:hypothetical protein
MKKLAVILLAVLIIGTMPAFAAEYSGITVDTMAVRGKGTAESVVQFNTTETLNTSTKLDTAGNNNSVASINNQTTESTKDLNESLVNVTIPQSLVNNSTKKTRPEL